MTVTSAFTKQTTTSWRVVGDEAEFHYTLHFITLFTYREIWKLMSDLMKRDSDVQHILQRTHDIDSA